MKKEPCIRLGMRIRPKIREKPDDSRNRSPPRARLLAARIAACAELIGVNIENNVSTQRHATDSNTSDVGIHGLSTGTAGLPLPIGERESKPVDRNPLTPPLSPAG